MQNNREVGETYEQLAGKYLETQGYKIIEYNYRCRIGEIDIIARNDQQYVFVEVKYRRNLRMGTPLEAVTVKKQRVISKCANYYVLCKGLSHCAMRFDVIGIVGTEIQHIENAFEYIG